MSPLLERACLLVLLALAIALALPTLADDNPLAGSEAPGVSSEEWQELVHHGRYLVHDAAMCVQCHSPRDANGALRQGRELTGAPMPAENPFPGPRWAFTAPNIRRAAGYTQEEFIHFLTTGERPNGTLARGPMPPYRMSQRDASAVWAYLRSL